MRHVRKIWSLDAMGVFMFIINGVFNMGGEVDGLRHIH